MPSISLSRHNFEIELTQPLLIRVYFYRYYTSKETPPYQFYWTNDGINHSNAAPRNMLKTASVFLDAHLALHN